MPRLFMRIRHCGVRCGDLSSLARQGLSWRGKVLHGRALYSEVLHSKVRQGSIMAWFRTVKSCPDWRGSVWHGFIKVLRGLALSGTVQSCPVWRCKARSFEVWYGLSAWSPVRLGQVVFGSAVCGKVLLWSGEVLFGVAGFSGALHSKVRSYCGEARHSIVKFCPVKHGLAGLGFIWSGDARWSAVRNSAVMQAKALLRSGIVWSGTVESGLARLRAAGQALVKSFMVRFCGMGFCLACSCMVM